MENENINVFDIMDESYNEKTRAYRRRLNVQKLKELDNLKFISYVRALIEEEWYFELTGKELDQIRDEVNWREIQIDSRVENLEIEIDHLDFERDKLINQCADAQSEQSEYEDFLIDFKNADEELEEREMRERFGREYDNDCEYTWQI